MGKKIARSPLDQRPVDRLDLSECKHTRMTLREKFRPTWCTFLKIFRIEVKASKKLNELFEVKENKPGRNVFFKMWFLHISHRVSFTLETAV